MKHLGNCVFFLLSVVVCISADVQRTLVGHWTFENGEEQKDLTGNFADIVLQGAEINNGQLDLGVSKWAVAGEYTGPTISEKTLVSWVSIDSLAVQRGSVLTIDKVSIDQFDAIVLGERITSHWMAGSSFFRRTTDPNPGFEETNENVMIQIAISYENNNGNAHIRLYRNGDMFGDYTKGPLVSWPKGDAEVFWGIRQGNANNGGPDNIDAHIEESRIYAKVLTSEELKELRPMTESKGIIIYTDLLAISVSQ